MKMIYVDNAGPAGRGVFATQTILPTVEIERAPAAPITAEERKAMKGMDFGEYPFVDRGEYAKRDDIRKRLPCPGFVAFGLSSIVNHSDRPNVRVDFIKEDGHWWAIMRAVTIIRAGDQLLLDYPDVTEYEDSDQWTSFVGGLADDGSYLVKATPGAQVPSKAAAVQSLPLRRLHDIQRFD